MTACQNCGTPLDMASTGRPRRWCSDRCRRAHATTPPPPRPPRAGGPGVVEVAVAALVDELGYPSDDPRHVIGILALQLANAVDGQPANVVLSRELRLCLAHLSDQPNEPPGAVDEIRAIRLKRRALYLLDRSQAGSDDA